MDVSTIANVATAITVLTGAIFGWFEVRHFRREREERAAFELLHTMLTSERLRSAVLVDSVPTASRLKFSRETKGCSTPSIQSD